MNQPTAPAEQACTTLHTAAVKKPTEKRKWRIATAINKWVCIYMRYYDSTRALLNSYSEHQTGGHANAPTPTSAAALPGRLMRC